MEREEKRERADLLPIWPTRVIRFEPSKERRCRRPVAADRRHIEPGDIGQIDLRRMTVERRADDPIPEVMLPAWDAESSTRCIGMRSATSVVVTRA